MVQGAEYSDINEVYPRLYMSNYSTARNIQIVSQYKITHILTVSPYCKPQFPQ